jgi:hypothetical protein
VRAKFAFSDAKMNISNPIITVIIEEKPVRLVLTTGKKRYEKFSKGHF